MQSLKLAVVDSIAYWTMALLAYAVVAFLLARQAVRWLWRRVGRQPRWD